MAQSVGTDIEYVYVEMVLNKERKYEVISGMFQGIKIRDGATFILLHGKKDITNIVNLRYYNIMTIEILHKDHKDMTYLTINDDDQKAALGMLDNVYKNLLKSNLGQDKEGDLINVSRYTNIPGDRGGDIIVKQQIQQDKTTHIQYNGVGNFANNRNGSSSTYRATKKEIVPTVFNRTAGSKKPSKSSLELMRGKIDQINEGNFECILPELIGATGEDDNDITNLYEGQDNFHWA